MIIFKPKLQLWRDMEPRGDILYDLKADTQ